MTTSTPSLQFNGGGHINHSIFWTNLSPNGGGEPSGELAEAIDSAFGSFEVRWTHRYEPGCHYTRLNVLVDECVRNWTNCVNFVWKRFCE